MCALSDAHHLTELVTAPFEPYDALICTSRAAVQQVRAVTSAFTDYLRDRHGGSPGLRPRLELIPLGVDTERYRPPTEAERADWRRALKVAEDEVVVLFVGRQSFHQKAHPFPMFRGMACAARRTGRKVHLVLTGDTDNEAVRRPSATVPAPWPPACASPSSTACSRGGGMGSGGRRTCLPRWPTTCRRPLG